MHVVVILLCLVANVAILFGEPSRTVMVLNPVEYFVGLAVINLVLVGAVKWLRADFRAH